jgi:hypothetical protein
MEEKGAKNTTKNEKVYKFPWGGENIGTGFPRWGIL